MSPESLGSGGSPNAGDYDTPYHKPVLCHTVVDALITDPGGVYVDGTLGGGGHTAALLDALDAAGRVIGIDRDDDALTEAGRRLAPAIEAGRLHLVSSSFGRIASVCAGLGMGQLDGVLLDLGVSSHQFDTADRGFSFRLDGPLDMRMETADGTPAAEWINHSRQEDLIQVLRQFGEVSGARRIAQSIAARRPLTTTGDLAEAVRAVVPSRDAAKILAQVFQALRITVNQELDELETALEAATDLIRPGGRIAVISYHSLEDRRVKRYLRYGNFEGAPLRDLHGNLITPWNPVWRKALAPDLSEVERNPRARSARLRVAERIPLPTPPTH